MIHFLWLELKQVLGFMLSLASPERLMSWEDKQIELLGEMPDWQQDLLINWGFIL